MRDRARWSMAVPVIRCLLVLGLTTGAPTPVDSDREGDFPLYNHITDLSANGMAGRVRNVGDAPCIETPFSGDRYDDHTMGVCILSPSAPWETAARSTCARERSARATTGA